MSAYLEPVLKNLMTGQSSLHIMKSFWGEGGSRALGAKGNKGKERGHKIRKLGDIVYGWFLKVIS